MDNFKNLLNPSQLRANAVMKAEAERLSGIADKIIDLLIKEEITTQELPRVISSVNTLINNKIDKAKIDDIIKLNDNRNK